MQNERTTTPLADLASRTPYSWIRERDVDLLVCMELYKNAELTNLFASRLGLQEFRFLWARVSHTEFDGESDLVVAFVADNAQVVAHVENKISAEFQPDQAKRYLARSQRWAAMEGVARSMTVLLAPADYMTRSGAENFEVRITYEEVSAALRVGADPRSIFLADALLAGVAAYQRGYVMTPDEVASALWQRLWAIASSMTPKLNYRRPGLKPKGGAWPSFLDAEGFLEFRRKEVELIFKMERGQADLQFSNTKAEVLIRRCHGILDDNMTVKPAGKSASIRISVLPIDFSGRADEQDGALLEGLSACERLRAFFVRYRDRLLPDQT